MGMEKVILRYLDGRIVKGHISSFSPSDESVSITDESSVSHTVSIHELKAIFFVKTFEGHSGYSERKSFTISASSGRKVFVRFKDGESMIGHIEGKVPWEKGFFLEPKKGGFFLVPVDDRSNNIKVFVVAGSVHDVTCF
jgi:hypothetical protein